MELQLTDNEVALKGFQAWQNEAAILHQEKVKVIIRAPEWANIGAKYKDMHLDPLPDDAPMRHLVDRMNYLRHALNAESPFRIDIVDGTGSTQFPDKYKTVGELRASYVNPGRP